MLVECICAGIRSRSTADRAGETGGALNPELCNRFYQMSDEYTEYSFVKYIGDLYVQLLRASRSRGNPQYVNGAAASLARLIDILAHKPETPLTDAVAKAAKRVGFPKHPEDEPDRSLEEVACAAITY